MARDEDDTRRDSDSVESEPRPRLGAGDVWRLIWRAYRESFPYLVIFLAALLLATWLITEVLF